MKLYHITVEVQKYYDTLRLFKEKKSIPWALVTSSKWMSWVFLVVFGSYRMKTLSSWLFWKKFFRTFLAMLVPMRPLHHILLPLVIVHYLGPPFWLTIASLGFSDMLSLSMDLQLYNKGVGRLWAVRWAWTPLIGWLRAAGCTAGDPRISL